MTTFEMMQSGAVLLLLTLIPGLLLSLSIRGTPRELISLLACSMGISLAYLIPLGIGLLAAGAFNLALVVVGCLPLVALAAWRRHQFFRSLQALHIDGGNAASIVVVLGALAVALIATPHWSFLINVAWDAGNYETYSNHFWLNGRLSLDISDILARDLPVEWSLSGPTWVIPENREGLLEPSQLLGFPVYLALIKLIFQQPDVAWIAMTLVAAMSASLLALIATRLSGRWWLGALVTLCVLATPLFYFYAKLAMSEQLGLLGVALTAFALLETDRDGISGEPDGGWGVASLIFCGLLVTFLTKLDAFPLALFFGIAMALAVIEQPNQRLAFARIAGASAAAFAGASVLNVLFVDPEYLSKFSLKATDGLIPVPFLMVYAIIIAGIALAAFAWIRHQPKTTLTPAFSQAVGVTITVVASTLWTLFLLWAWMLRPLEWSGDLLDNHDLVNLTRLGPVTSPVLLAITLLGFPVVFAKASPALRYLLLFVGSFLCYMLWKSYHSPYELIWMRRYLMALIPTMTMVTAFAVGLLIKHRLLAAPALAAGLAAVLTIQLLYLEPLLQHELNTVTAKQVLALDKRIPDRALLVVNNTPEADERPETPSWVLRGAGNTLRSLRSGPTLLNVSDDALRQAISAFPEAGQAYVLTVEPPSESLRQELNLRFQAKLPLSIQYSSWLKRIRQNPTEARTATVFIFSAAIDEAARPD